MKHGNLLAVHDQELFVSVLDGCDGAFKGRVDAIKLQLVDHAVKVLKAAIRLFDRVFDSPLLSRGAMNGSLIAFTWRKFNEIQRARPPHLHSRRKAANAVEAVDSHAIHATCLSFLPVSSNCQGTHWHDAEGLGIYAWSLEH